MSPLQLTVYKNTHMQEPTEKKLCKDKQLNFNKNYL